MENKYLKRAHELRNDPAVHYNCAQAVIMPFARECDISEEQGAALGMHFGGGMKMGSVCGAIAGGAVVIGMMGGRDDVYQAFLSAMRTAHDGDTDCAALLKKNALAGGDRKVHCDGMIYEAIEYITEIMGL